MNKRKVVLAVATGVFASFALGLSGVDWSRWVSNDSTVLLSSRTWQDDPAKYTEVKAIRRAISGGRCEVEARVETCNSSLAQIRLLVADDENGDDVIARSEWTEVAVAAPSRQGEMFVATTGFVSVPANKDAYRIEHRWTGWGVSFDDVVASGLHVE